MPVVRVFGLNFSANRKDLVAATYGRGVWIYPLAAAGMSAALPARTSAGGHGTSSGAGPSLATTGGSAGMSLVGVALIGAAVLLRRRQLRSL